MPSLSLFLFLHVQYCTLIAFQAPLCLPVFQLQSLLALPSLVSSKLSLHLSRLYSSPSFFSSPASNLLSSLLTCARFPSLIFFFFFWEAHAHLLLFLWKTCAFTTHPFQNPNGYHQQNTRVNHTSALRLRVCLCLEVSLHLKRNEEVAPKKMSVCSPKTACLFSLCIWHIFQTFLSTSGSDLIKLSLRGSFCWEYLLLKCRFCKAKNDNYPSPKKLLLLL